MQDSEDVNTFICCLGLLLHSELLLEAVTSSQVQDVEKASYQAYTTRYIMAIENENKHPRMPVLLKTIFILKYQPIRPFIQKSNIQTGKENSSCT